MSTATSSDSSPDDEPNGNDNDGVDSGDRAGASEQPMRLRRAPKLAPFVLLGAGLGLIVTLTLTSLFPADPSVGFSVLAGYFSLYGVTGGIGLGLLFWLLLDRRSKKRERDITAEKED
ncbi:hypothetical protein [Pontimonas sp.]|uniref:hypothetical protein n=1 Tax=Pontimonas sp. TaxID=2304492 RepID=UPI0028708DC1|nr:hypothetical protein [Pontimonas sp.]MDR9434794.1 hypothetical protein [Pontimonas sp.]